MDIYIVEIVERWKYWRLLGYKRISNMSIKVKFMDQVPPVKPNKTHLLFSCNNLVVLSENIE